MLLTALVAAEAFSPRLDGLTVRNPRMMRSLVGEVAMTKVGYGKDSGKQLDRVLKLDPENAEALGRLCTANVNTGSGQALQTCRKALAQDPSELNYNGLGLAQEKAGAFCDAEDSFTTANSKVNARDAYVLSNMGRVALKCGHAAAAVASFEIAEGKDVQDVVVAKAEGEDEDDARDTLLQDREWLIVAYGRNGNMKQAAAMCATAHPTWKTCSCSFDDKGVHCQQPVQH